VKLCHSIDSIFAASLECSCYGESLGCQTFIAQVNVFALGVDMKTENDNLTEIEYLELKLSFVCVIFKQTDKPHDRIINLQHK
jgi:hypothetical protein